MIKNSMISTIAISALLFVFIFGTFFCAKPGGMGAKDILVWVSYGPDEMKVFNDIAEKWSKENKNGFTVHVAQIPWMGQESKYRTSLIAGSPPDIGRVDTTFVPELAYNQILEDVNKFIEEEAAAKKIGTNEILAEYVPAAIDSCIIHEKSGKNCIYGFPDQTNGACLFYNKDLFRQAGLDPDKAPKTWADFLEYAKKLTNKDADRFGFGMDNSLWWSFPFFNTYGTKFLSDDGQKCLLNSQEAKDALQFKVDLFRKYAVEGGAWASGGQNTETGFMNGRYAMILMGPWNVSRFKNAKINFAVSLVPEGPKGTSTNVGGTNMVIFKKKRTPDQLKACYEFLRHLTSADIQAEWGSKLRQIPVNLKAYDKIKIDDTEEASILKVFMEQMKTAQPRPKVLKYAQLETLINPEMEAALSGAKTVEQALNAACGRIDAEALK
ncbi:MAG TPA: ABC transporter substrate-binding protein [Candidatus Wallbacteria bacterium]|nr:ABC transporter substrate-binding protein [Candidatus Wallbacteria bacterium]